MTKSFGLMAGAAALLLSAWSKPGKGPKDEQD